MAKYLKKKKIYKLVQSMGYPVPALGCCTYKFHRGSEWFVFDSMEKEDYCYSFFFCESYMSVEKLLCVDSNYLLVNRKLYSDKEYSDILFKVS